MKISEGKFRGMEALSDSQGVIRAAAMDQRGSLKKAIAKFKGVDPKEITSQMMEEFKVVVSKVLTPHASAILLDPQWGLPAAAHIMFIEGNETLNSMRRRGLAKGDGRVLGTVGEFEIIQPVSLVVALANHESTA